MRRSQYDANMMGQPFPARPLHVYVGPPHPMEAERIHVPPGFHNPFISRERQHPRRSKSTKRHSSPQRSNSRRPEATKDPLRQWSDWRTGINEDLGKDLVRQTYRPILVGTEFDDLMQPSSRSNHGVYHYSATVDQATQLHKEDFVNFGIPRAQMSRASPKRSPSADSRDSEETETPFYSINKIKDPDRINAGHQLPSRGRPHRERNGYRDNSEDRHQRSRKGYRDVSPDIVIENRRSRSSRSYR